MRMRFMLIWGLMALALVTFTSAVYAQNEETVVSISASAGDVRAGEEITVTLLVQNAVGVYGSSLKVSFDPQILMVVTQNEQAVAAGDFFADQPELTIRNNVDPDTGVIEYAMTLRQPAEAVSGDGVLGIIQMRALRDAPVVIEITEAQLLAPQFEEVNGQEIAASVESIPVKIESMTVSVSTDTASAPIVEAAPESSLPSSDDVVNPVAGIVSRLGDRSSPGVVIGAVFFLIGLVLFLIGLRTYTRLYRRYGT